jgi:hypothetical protein
MRLLLARLILATSSRRRWQLHDQPMALKLDPRWEWIEVVSFGQPTRWIRGHCRHLEVVPVESGGEQVTQLCLTCDTQLPPGREPGAK